MLQSQLLKCAFIGSSFNQSLRLHVCSHLLNILSRLRRMQRFGQTSNKRTTSHVTDVEMKERGNKFFISRKYEDAVQCYSSAIQRNPSNPIYYTNRALARLRQSRYEDVAADCRAAVELEPNCIKGHFFLGQALCELGVLDEGIKHIQRAADLAKEYRRNFGDEITNVLRSWRKRRLGIQEEKRLNEEIELQSYINKLIREDRDRQVEKIKAQHSSQADPDESQLVSSITKVEQYSDCCIKDLNSILAKVDERRRKREIPDFLCGKISFEILRDPVVTPSGITYERKDIEEHLMRVGHFDPVTRVKLTSDQLIPNYAMKEVVDAFIAENSWALDY